MLAVDIGNTRLKWGWRDTAGVWCEFGALPLGDLSPATLAAAWAPLPAPRVTVGACVAGAAWRDVVAAAVALRWGDTSPAVRWQVSSPAAAGVRNAYARPERLGVDRWAAAVGAWHLAPEPAVVVCAGTATTVDLLLPAAADETEVAAVFHGGYILPGFDLMRGALAGETAQLPLATGNLYAVPQLTDDAIVSGCLWAQAGAVARLVRELPGGGRIWLTGGGADRLQVALVDTLSTLPQPPAILLRETLILDGLVALAGVFSHSDTIANA
jgi:type III pantothenate kinase